MRDVIHVSGCRTSLPKQRDALLQVGPAVAHDGPRNSRHRDDFFQLPLYGLAVGMLHRLQVQQPHVLVFQGPRLSLPSGEPQADDEQSFVRTQLDGVIDEPDPVVGRFLGTAQLVKAQAEEPGATCIGGRRFLAAGPELCDPAHDRGGRPLTARRRQDQLHEPANRAQRVVLPGQAAGEIGRQRELARGLRRCRLIRCRLIRVRLNRRRFLTPAVPPGRDPVRCPATGPAPSSGRD